MKKRKTNIEIIKIFALFIIVINHITMSLTTNNLYSSKYLIPEIATNNLQHMIIFFFRYFGSYGNCIFVICSSWFLLENSKIKFKKIFSILINVYIISILFLLFFILFTDIIIEPKYIIYSLFPNIFSNNWFITCYVLLYLIHPFLNIIIKSLNQKQLFSFNIITFILYMIIGSIKSNLLFNNELIMFIVIYMYVAYIKLYMKKFQKSNKINLRLFILSSLMILLGYLTLNYLGLKIDIFSNKIIHFNNLCNPFIFLSAISLFNIFNNKDIKESKIINYISSISLLIYIIHENILVLNYIRPLLYVYIYNNYGYKYIIICVLFLSIIWFIISTIISIIYNKTLYVIVDKIINYFSKKIINIKKNKIFKKTLRLIGEINYE